MNERFGPNRFERLEQGLKARGDRIAALRPISDAVDAQVSRSKLHERAGTLAAVSLTLAMLAAFTRAEATNSGQTLGDVDCSGQTNSIDAALVLQKTAGLIGALSCEEAGDVNRDGLIGALDAALILQKDAGLINLFPAEFPTPVLEWPRDHSVYEQTAISDNLKYIARKIGMFPASREVEGQWGILVKTPLGFYRISSRNRSLIAERIDNDGTMYTRRGEVFQFEIGTYILVETSDGQPLEVDIFRKPGGEINTPTSSPTRRPTATNSPIPSSTLVPTYTPTEIPTSTATKRPTETSTLQPTETPLVNLEPVPYLRESIKPVEPVDPGTFRGYSGVNLYLDEFFYGHIGESLSNTHRDLIKERFRDFEVHGVKLVRLSPLFADMRRGAGILFESGTPSEFVPIAAQNLQFILEQAQNHNIKLIIPLIDFMAADGVTVENGYTIGEHPLVFNDSTKRQALLDVFKQYLQQPIEGAKTLGNHPAILAWEPANEWNLAIAATTAGQDAYLIEGIAMLGETAADKPVSLSAQTQRALWTRGWIKLLRPGDFAQAHLYPPGIREPLDLSLGEVNVPEGVNMLIGEADTDLLYDAEAIRILHNHGYIGVMFWHDRNFNFDAAKYKKAMDEAIGK